MDVLKPTLALCLNTLIASFLSPGSLYAAERLSLAHLSFSDLQRLIPVSLSEQTPQQVISATHDLLFLNQHMDEHQTNHIRMQQRYDGFSVLGGYAIFHHPHNSSSFAAISMNGVLYQKLQHDLGARPVWFVSRADHVLHHYAQKYPQHHMTEKQITPLIYVDDHQQAHWAYQVSVFLQPEQGDPGRPTFIIEAKTNQILAQWDDLATVRQRVRGLGFGGNTRIGKHQFGKELPFLDLIRDENSGRCFLENDHVLVVDMGHHTQRQTIPMSFDCEEEHATKEYWTGSEGDGYDEVNGGYSVSNDAMYAGELVKNMYRTQYGVDVLRVGYKPMQLILRVHYSRHYANAFWDGRQMTFGDGDGAIHPLVSLGIAAHEISHGFTQQHSGLLYHGQAGGINESFSDMAAQAAEYFVYGKASWQIGGDIMKGRGALRFLHRPSLDGVSIERADRYRRDMDVHHSSGVYNHLFYLLSQRPGWNPGKAFRVMIKANMDYWTPTSNFAEGACGILAASRDLGFGETDVQYALDEVMIEYDDC
ncbi:MAG: zinc protease [Legionella sp.]|nr:MAG: zinc protease [Legionella sp.]